MFPIKGGMNFSKRTEVPVRLLMLACLASGLNHSQINLTV